MAYYLSFFKLNPLIITIKITATGKKVNGIYFNASICKAPEINVPLTPHGTIELTAAPASFNVLVRYLCGSFNLSYEFSNACPGNIIDKYCSPTK